MTGRWHIYKPKVGNPKGRWVAESPQHVSWIFCSWVDAMRWADPLGRLEVWLAAQPVNRQWEKP